MRTLNIQNINSKDIINFYIDEQSIISKLDYLVHKAFKIPVYLVDEELMDFFYPPYKRKLLDEKAAKELLTHLNQNDDEKRDFEKDTQKIKEMMNRFYETSQERTSEKEPLIVAVGLYIHDSTNKLGPNFKDYQKLLSKINYPCILICPERVLSWAQGLYISPKTLFELVYYHELAHAYIHCDFRDYQKPWYRIIEEAYCNAVSFERFKVEKDISEIEIAISKQPVEYRGYTFFTGNNISFWNLDIEAQMILKDMERILGNSSSFWNLDNEEFFYLLQRFRRIWYYPPYFFERFTTKFFKRVWNMRTFKEDRFVWLALSILDEILG